MQKPKAFNQHGIAENQLKCNFENGNQCNFTKINTPPWVFFMFFKLYKWYQIAQRITYLTANFHDQKFHFGRDTGSLTELPTF